MLTGHKSFGGFPLWFLVWFVCCILMGFFVSFPFSRSKCVYLRCPFPRDVPPACTDHVDALEQRGCFTTRAKPSEAQRD